MQIFFCLSSLLANSELAAPSEKLFHPLSAFTVSYVLHSLLPRYQVFFFTLYRAQFEESSSICGVCCGNCETVKGNKGTVLPRSPVTISVQSLLEPMPSIPTRTSFRSLL